MATLDVNTDELIGLTVKLEKTHRSAFPSAVRNTLNRAAFETKKNVPKVAGQKFITRSKTFFRAFSVVDKADGFNVNSMVATVGINASKGRRVADGLEKQEFGGTIKGNKTVPHDDARTSRNRAKRVARRNRFDGGDFHRGNRAFRGNRGSRKSKFVAAVFSAAKSGRSRMLLKTGSRGMIYEVRGVSSNRRTRKVTFKLKKLYAVRSVENSRVKKSPFMKPSAMLAAKKIDMFYKEAAEFQFKKALKR